MQVALILHSSLSNYLADVSKVILFLTFHEAGNMISNAKIEFIYKCVSTLVTGYES